jgi:hypothetical protein
LKVPTSTPSSAYSGALEAVDRILNRGGDADDVLRAVVTVVHEKAGFRWAGIASVEEGASTAGPSQGDTPGEEAAYPISFSGDRVGELRVAPPPDDGDGHAFLERVALLISPYCRSG